MEANSFSGTLLKDGGNKNPYTKLEFECVGCKKVYQYNDEYIKHVRICLKVKGASGCVLNCKNGGMYGTKEEHMHHLLTECTESMLVCTLCQKNLLVN